MARYISRAQAFKKAVVKPKQEPIQLPTGATEMRETEKGLIAFFEQGGATPAEVSLALERFQFKGLAEKEDPARRISIYDTDEQAGAHGWDDTFKARVEAVLDQGQSSDYFRVEEIRAPLPWPSYDALNAKDVFATAELIGVDADVVLAYERENANRETVLNAFAKTSEVEVAA